MTLSRANVRPPAGGPGRAVRPAPAGGVGPTRRWRSPAVAPEARVPGRPGKERRCYFRRVREHLTRLAEELRAPGSTAATGPELWKSGRVGITMLIVATNVVGVVAVLVAAYLVVPLPGVGASGHVRTVNAIAAAIYVAVALPLGATVGVRSLASVRRWLLEDRPAQRSEQ